MSLWTEGCEFTIAGHPFAIRKVSLWKDGFQLFAGDQSVCDVKRGFWSRRFELDRRPTKTGSSHRPAGSRGTTSCSPASEREVGTIRPTGWFTRTRVADFADEVPPPVQVFAIFLVLVVSQRQQKHASTAAASKRVLSSAAAIAASPTAGSWQAKFSHT